MGKFIICNILIIFVLQILGIRSAKTTYKEIRFNFQDVFINFSQIIKYRNVWKSLIMENYTRNKILKVIDYLYPYNQMTQKVFFYEPDKKVEKYDGKGIYGTEEVQKIIYQNQNPENCSNRNFFIMPSWREGFGAQIHMTAGVLANAINMNRTLLFSAKYQNDDVPFDKCNGTHSLECFNLPISSCSFTTEQIKADPKRFKLYHDVCSAYHDYPKSIIPYIKKTGIPEKIYHFYWKIQSSYFFYRVSDKMKRWVADVRNTSLVNPKDNYDVMVHIRHGDKHREMKLIDAKDYIYPLEILSKILQRRISVFILSDDQKAVDYLKNLDSNKYDISYFNFTRLKNGFHSREKRDNFANSIHVYADINEAIKAKYLIGTMRSNIDRLILELRLQYGESMDLPFFDVSEIFCATPIECKLRRMDINFFD